ncbi:MAG: NADPH:quinone reductase [Candidatus Dormibacteraeota bacterium]|uniref:NADPH:quinone reductase n=1 Tax=Candidatus Aeolococcus gillhamiae TaxID=3127015 RepID=A0A934K310_9BACT|nr:NADPH:quinone reductase [Candidatus Dormibacteraeota bacterium]
MKAVQYERQGVSAEVLRVVDLPTPDPGPGEVRVRVRFSGVNPTDWKSRSGATARPVDGFQIPHHDGSGVIDAVGAGVDPGRLGQRVWLWLAAAGRRRGTAAEWTVIPQRQAVALPDRVSLELGASLGVPALTAHRCLFADGELVGRTVLVAGGAGAVGHFAVQLAKYAGARVVATVSGPAKAELARTAGADLVVNYGNPDAVEQIRAFAERVDRVVEVNLATNLTLDLALAGPDTVVAAYAADAPDPELPVRACMSANVVLRFVLLYGVPGAELDRGVADVSAALQARALTELPVHRFPLEECAAAQDAVQGGAVGKVLLDLG